VRDLGADQRELFRRWPSGVSVVVAEREGRKAGLTVNSLLSVSLEPPLVAVSLALVASLYEVLREAGEWAVSILSGEQEHLAQHFARSVPPLVQWDGIRVRTDDMRLLEDAVGWLRVRTLEEVPAGDHTLFVGEVVAVERGSARGSLVYLDRRYHSL
jgi:flavin reductase (DIM6/NTAB) family NADH-FMN oxidoreductase RutF